MGFLFLKQVVFFTNKNVLPYFLHPRKWEQLALFTSDLLIRNSTIIFISCNMYALFSRVVWQIWKFDKFSAHCVLQRSWKIHWLGTICFEISRSEIVNQYSGFKFKGSEMTWSSEFDYSLTYLHSFLVIAMFGSWFHIFKDYFLYHGCNRFDKNTSFYQQDVDFSIIFLEIVIV